MRLKRARQAASSAGHTSPCGRTWRRETHPVITIMYLSISNEDRCGVSRLEERGQCSVWCRRVQRTTVCRRMWQRTVSHSLTRANVSDRQRKRAQASQLTSCAMSSCVSGPARSAAVATNCSGCGVGPPAGQPVHDASVVGGCAQETRSLQHCSRPRAGTAHKPSLQVLA